MENGDKQAEQAAKRRKLAEEKAARSPETIAAMSSEETHRMLHELRVHQIELEMQNEELRQIQAELDASRTRYFNLYNHAPAGYCTLNEQGVILESNLAAAAMLGAERCASVKFTRFILKKDQDIYYLHRKQLLETGTPQTCELRMVKTDGTVFWAHLATIAAQDANGNPLYHIVLNDISERKFQEEGRALTSRLIVLVNTPGDFRARISEITDSLQNWSGCEAVGIRLHDGDDYPYYETRGFPPVFVQAENRLCAYDQNGEILRDSTGNPVLECMCGNILRGRFDPAKPFFTAHGSFWSNNTTALLASTTEADRQAHTRNRCNTEGYESVALIPLRAGNEVFGLLQFNDRRPNRFTANLIDHFEKMADSLAVALAQRQAEEALNASISLLNASLESTADGLLIVNSDRKISKWNQKFAGMWQISEKILSTGNDADVISHILPQVSDPERFVTNVEYLYAHPEESSFDQINFLDGRIFERYSQPKRIGDEIVGRVWSFRDVTERKKAEEALRVNEARLHKIINNTLAGYFFVDRKRRYRSVNDAWLRMHGYDSPDDVIGQLFTMTQIDADREPARKIIDLLLAGNTIPTGEFSRRCRDGSIRYHTFSAHPVTEDGEIVGLEGFIIDATDRKQAEEEIKLKNAELLKINAEKDKFFSIIAHDLRSPFNSFLMLTKIMAEGSPGLTIEEMQSIAAGLGDLASNIFRLLENLLQWSIIQQGLMLFNPQAVRLLPIADESMAMAREAAQHKGIKIACDIPDDMAVFAESNMLQTVIRNLVSNAVKFTSQGGKITLSAKVAGDKSVEISVKDSGIGMSQAIIDDLFRLDVKTHRTGTENEQVTDLHVCLISSIQYLDSKCVFVSRSNK